MRRSSVFSSVLSHIFSLVLSLPCSLFLPKTVIFFNFPPPFRPRRRFQSLDDDDDQRDGWWAQIGDSAKRMLPASNASVAARPRPRAALDTRCTMALVEVIYARVRDRVTETNDPGRPELNCRRADKCFRCEAREPSGCNRGKEIMGNFFRGRFEETPVRARVVRSRDLFLTKILVLGGNRQKLLSSF